MFEMVDTLVSPALGYMEIVPQRTAAIPLPIVQQHVRPGKIIHSDEWASYRQIQSLPSVAQHSTVNHSITFIDPTIGTHTQSYWKGVKTKFNRMKGVHDEMLPSYLNEFMWTKCT